MDEEILQELKTLNEKLSKDLELRSKELQIQVDKTQADKELREIEQQEQEQEKLELEKEKAKAEVRAIQLEQFINRLNSEAESDQQFKVDQMAILSTLNNKDELESINVQLNSITESLEVTEQGQLENDASYFSSMTIIVFLCFAVPAFATYKFLSRLFDSFIA